MKNFYGNTEEYISPLLPGKHTGKLRKEVEKMGRVRELKEIMNSLPDGLNIDHRGFVMSEFWLHNRNWAPSICKAYSLGCQAAIDINNQTDEEKAENAKKFLAEIIEGGE